MRQSIDAPLDGNEREKGAELARLREEAVKHDPHSTDEDIAAAREARKDAELNATLNDADLVRRIAELERSRLMGQQTPAGVPTYPPQPYVEYSAFLASYKAAGGTG